MKLKILDLFCGAGGAAMGYYRAFQAAGIDVDITGVDITPQQNYPFAMRVGDAMEWSLRGYDFVHASPPCQEYSFSRFLRNATTPDHDVHPMLIAEIHKRLCAAGVPYVIENVEGAPMPENNIMLCGSMFGLPIRRHRLFAFPAQVMVLAPYQCQHKRNEPIINAIAGKIRGYGSLSTDHIYTKANGQLCRREHCLRKETGQQAMGIDWMTVEEMCQAIPPAYTEWIGRQIINILRVKVSV